MHLGLAVVAYDTFGIHSTHSAGFIFAADHKSTVSWNSAL